MNAPAVRVVLVEDHPGLARDLRMIMARQPGFIVVATGASVKEALLLIPATEPDLLILDVELGDGLGFDILSALWPLSFKVIFATAYQGYAIKAIKYGALDYLLKPIDEVELRAALDKFKDAEPVDPKQVALAQQQYLSPGVSGLIALRSQPHLKIVALSEIIYLQSDEQTIFHLTGNRTVAVAKPLKEYEDLLPIQQFLRPHHGYMVNLIFVEHYHHDGYLVLRNGLTIPVSTRRRMAIVNFLTGLHKK